MMVEVLVEVLRRVLPHLIRNMIVREFVHRLFLAFVGGASWNRVKLDKTVVELIDGIIDVLRVAFFINGMLNIDI